MKVGLICDTIDGQEMDEQEDLLHVGRTIWKGLQPTVQGKLVIELLINLDLMYNLWEKNFNDHFYFLVLLYI